MNYLFALITLLIGLNLHCLAQSGSIPQPEITKVSIDLYTDETFIHWKEVNHIKARYYFVTKGVNANGNISWRRRFLDNTSPEPVLSGTSTFTSFDDPEVKEKSPIYNIQVCTSEEADSCSYFEDKPYECSIFLQGTFDSCFAKVNLKWNDFKLWKASNTKYYVYSTLNKTEFIKEGEFNSETEYAEVDVTNPQADIAYFIAAIKNENNTIDSATSNAITLNTTMARIPESINADFATYEEKNTMLQFSIDPLSNLNKYYILRSTSPEGPFEKIDSLITTEKTIRYSDKSNYLMGPYYYKLNALNYCNNPVMLSNAASTIVLSVNQNVRNMELSWNDYQQWMAGVETYSIYRSFGKEDFELLTKQSNNTYIDDLTSAVEEEKNQVVCYYIEAKENENNHLGQVGLSLSNEVCQEISPNIRFEFNAFIPGSEEGNNSFGPAMDFTPNTYVFQIFSQAGFIIYESTDPRSTRWDGRINGSNAPSGAYTYIVQYELNGETNTLKGMVSVVY